MSDLKLSETNTTAIGTELVGNTFNPRDIDDYVFQVRSEVRTMHGIKAYGGQAEDEIANPTNGPGGPGVRGIGGNGSGNQPPGPGVIGQAGSPSADGAPGHANGVEGYGTGRFSGVAGYGGNIGAGENTGTTPGTGVLGIGGLTEMTLGGGGAPGVRGIGGGGPDSSPDSAVGVYGQGGDQSPGVVGQAGSRPANGVEGYGTGNFSGVVGSGDPTSTGTGVLGFGGTVDEPNPAGANGTGVRGIGAGGPNTAPGTPVGVYGQGGPEGAGVYGSGSVAKTVDGVTGPGVLGVGAGGSFTGLGTAVGVVGQAGPNADGVFGRSDQGQDTTAAGVHGQSIVPNGNGVIGEVYEGAGAVGVWGRTPSPDLGFAGLFDGKVLIKGELIVTGAKSAVVPLPDDSHRRMYSLECPESWFEDFGFGQLVNGQAQIQFDPDFASTVNTDAYHVFITEYEDNNSLYVANRSSTGFEVRAKAPTTDSTFSYRVVAKRKDITPARLEKVTLPDKPQLRRRPESSANRRADPAS
jgi:hypothetical protein